MATQEPAMRPTGTLVEVVLNRAKGPRRQEVDQLLELFKGISGEEPVVWANRIIGFGEYEYTYPSGHSGRAPRYAFAPGPSNHTIYLASGYADRWPNLVERLGPHKASRACLYLTRLANVDPNVLRELIELSAP